MSELADFIKSAEDLLQRAAADRKSPMRTPVLTTVFGAVPYQRTVVLRRFDRALRELIFYTDARSEKVGHLRKNPAAGLSFWHPKRSVQVRLRGRITVETDTANARQHYAQLPEYGRKTYATRLAPGTPIAQSIATYHELSAPETAANFALLRFVATEIDVLELGREQHRRAQQLLLEGTWNGTWLVP